MTKLELLEEFESVTDQLIALDLSQSSDLLINEVEKLLEKREQIIEQVNALNDPRPMDKSFQLRLIEKNNQLGTILEEIKLGLEVNMSDVKKEKALSSIKKKATRGYMNVERQMDGYFIDKKK